MELELVPKEAFGNTEKRRSGNTAPAYSGKERRRHVRRTTVDRRAVVRFEDRTDRRSSGERRTGLRMWDGRSF